MKVLSVASECAPLVKTGGLADVVGALPAALAAHGVEMRTVVPAYPGLIERLEDPRRAEVALAAGGGPGTVVAGEAAGLSLILVDAPALFDRPGGPYSDAAGAPWPDDHLRFGWFCRVAAAIAARGLDGWTPDAVHVHDWQAGLVPVHLRLTERAGPPALATLHNVAFKGECPASELSALGLPSAAMTIDGVEFHGRVSFLKGAIAMADRISTVSPTYARELTGPLFGMGLDGLLRHRARDFSGVLNGIDETAWDPATDAALTAPYSAADPSGKAANRAALAERFGLEAAADAPLFVVVSRMTGQKGLDLILDALPRLIDRGATLAVLGSGEPAMERAYAEAAGAHPGRVGVVVGYDEPLSHLMQGGGDAILVPSRFEPCGLTQLYGLRYGTLPVVARTGGLADTVIDANDAGLRAGCATGLLHDPGSAAALGDAIGRACDLFAAPDGTWAAMRAAAMRHPVGWERSAADYAALYRSMGAAA